ncbi:DNA topoisomerase I [Campylobacter ureolyticus]|nr:DNA topoisomerase I [Campylobacter ureolyticus]
MDVLTTQNANFISNYELTNEACPNCENKHLIKKELKSGTFLECTECKYKRKIDV